MKSIFNIFKLAITFEKLLWKQSMTVDITNIISDQIEGFLKELIENIDNLKEIESALDMDIQNMVERMSQFKHNSDEYHNGEDILTHTKWVLNDLETLIENMDDERKVVLRLAALMHDLGKAYTYEVQPDGKHTFRNHAEKSVELASVLLEKHKENLGSLYDRVIDLISKHDLFIQLLNGRKNSKNIKYLNKFMQDSIYLGGHLEDLLILSMADGNRSQVKQRTLDDIKNVLDDIKKFEEQKKEKEYNTIKKQENFKNKLPEIQNLLLNEGFSEAAFMDELSEINSILGKNKKYDLIKKIKMMLE
jgi:putative nucleotidyltransferase with HDIG domain